MLLLAHLSDLHLDGSARARERAARVLAHIDALPRRVDAMLVTGDLTDHGTDDEYREVRDLLGDRGALHCPGNHDDRAAYRRTLLGGTGDEPVVGAHDLPGARIVLYDSTIPGEAGGELTAWTADRLSELLADAPATPTLLAFHHPPTPLHSPEIDAIRQRSSERLDALLRANPQVVALLCGHAHTPAVTTFGGRPLVVAPGVRSGLRLPWEGPILLDDRLPPGLAFHVLDGDRLTTHFRLLPDV
ncbi:metallophosphoesterase [Pseudonocardia benzenivorans]|jgi:3',5'-cyclic AMP phosphodiesterase CpdA|uniref:Metallophosphoesterase n=2 Tax=Pseudonocardia TaxID=1847 RepID=F4CVA8_PSEUX|nr:metallophosphoesterase [Pseudonocardia dioxanivorans]AEA23172.1 metallophosphoesterase [Pseudonocardia dioxanivorans CB1190]